MDPGLRELPAELDNTEALDDPIPSTKTDRVGMDALEAQLAAAFGLAGGRGPKIRRPVALAGVRTKAIGRGDAAVAAEGQRAW